MNSEHLDGLDHLDGQAVTAKRAGWDEVLPPESDLDPYDALEDGLEGVLEIRDVGGSQGVPRYTQYLVAGNPADPKTIRIVEGGG